MSLKELVDEYLKENFATLEQDRTSHGFSWKPVLHDINNRYNLEMNPEEEIQRDYVRGRFKKLRKAAEVWGEKFEESKITIPVGHKVKRLIYDIETAPNLVFSWSIGSKCFLSIDNIVKERAIMTICWKFEGDKDVSYLTWDKGDDKEMLIKFAEIMNSADEIITFNGDNFDTKWVRGRCLYHSIPLSSRFNSIDVLKLSRKQFKLNSNKLTYVAQYLGLGKKVDTGGFDLWKKICLYNDEESMKLMVNYCQGDVELLEKVYNVVREYSHIPKFRIVPNKQYQLEAELN